MELGDVAGVVAQHPICQWPVFSLRTLRIYAPQLAASKLPAKWVIATVAVIDSFQMPVCERVKFFLGLMKGPEFLTIAGTICQFCWLGSIDAYVKGTVNLLFCYQAVIEQLRRVDFHYPSW